MANLYEEIREQVRDLNNYDSDDFTPPVGVDLDDENTRNWIDSMLMHAGNIAVNTIDDRNKKILQILEEARKTITQLVLEVAGREQDNIKPGKVVFYKIPILDRIIYLLEN